MVNFLLDPIVNATTPRGIYDIPSPVFWGGMSAIDVVSLPPLSLSSFPVPTVGRSFYGSVFFPYASSVSMSMGLWGDRWYDSDLMFTGALLASRDGLGFGLPPLGPYPVYPTYPFFALPPLQISEFKMPPVGNFMRMSGDPSASEQPSGNDHTVAPPPPPSGPPPAYGGGQEGEEGGSGPGNGAVSQGRRHRIRSRNGADPLNPPPDSAQVRQFSLRSSNLGAEAEAKIKEALRPKLGDGQIFSVFSFHLDDPKHIFVGSNSVAYQLKMNLRAGTFQVTDPIGVVREGKLLIPESK